MYNQTTVEISLNIVDTICKSDSNTNTDLYVKLLNGLINFTKYTEKIFATKISKENEFSVTYKLFKNGNNLFIYFLSSLMCI